MKEGQVNILCEGLFADGVCWPEQLSHSLEREVCSYHSRSPHLLEVMDVPETLLPGSFKGMILIFSFLFSLQFKSNCLA
jgi:hypothetical protein